MTITQLLVCSLHLSSLNNTNWQNNSSNLILSRHVGHSNVHDCQSKHSEVWMFVTNLCNAICSTKKCWRRRCIQDYSPSNLHVLCQVTIAHVFSKLHFLWCCGPIHLTTSFTAIVHLIFFSRCAIIRTAFTHPTVSFSAACAWWVSL